MGVDGCGMDCCLRLVEILYELGDTSVIMEGLLPSDPLVLEVYRYLLIEERLVAEPVLEGGVIELHRLEDRRVGVECDSRPCPVRIAYDGDGTVGNTGVIGLTEDLAFPLDDCLHLGGQTVYDRDTDSVETS